MWEWVHFAGGMVWSLYLLYFLVSWERTKIDVIVFFFLNAQLSEKHAGINMRNWLTLRHKISLDGTSWNWFTAGSGSPFPSLQPDPINRCQFRSGVLDQLEPSGSEETPTHFNNFYKSKHQICLLGGKQRRTVYIQNNSQLQTHLTE